MILHDLVAGKTGEEAITFLLKAGLLPVTVIEQAEIFNTFTHFLKFQSTAIAALSTARMHGCDIRTVYRAIKKFRITSN
jgi:hypothetical protein